MVLTTCWYEICGSRVERSTYFKFTSPGYPGVRMMIMARTSRIIVRARTCTSSGYRQKLTGDITHVHIKELVMTVSEEECRAVIITSLGDKYNGA